MADIVICQGCNLKEPATCLCQVIIWGHTGGALKEFKLCTNRPDYTYKLTENRTHCDICSYGYQVKLYWD